ncbi:MAG: translocase [Rhodospirillaceae bacterium]|nr:MAG: translocase [Rhodospirillaceae bacterium]
MARDDPANGRVEANALQFLDILFFAAIAAFLAFRLWGVLGRRSDIDRRPPAPSWRPHEDKDDASSVRSKGEEENVVRLPDRSEKKTPPSQPSDDTPSSAPIDAAMRKADPGFDPDEFLAGASAAFEMVVDAFAHGDKETLQPLLSKDVYSRFAGAIDVRAKAEEVLETTVIRIVDATIKKVVLKGNVGQITVAFVSEQIKVTWNKAGDILDGDPNHVKSVADLWTFQRDLRAANPNWVLTATHGSA